MKDVIYCSKCLYRLIVDEVSPDRIILRCRIQEYGHDHLVIEDFALSLDILIEVASERELRELLSYIDTDDLRYYLSYELEDEDSWEADEEDLIELLIKHHKGEGRKNNDC